ncbi:MAG TPA: phosphotransferase family protein [Stellaceae bacterium]|jgi:aminoglycoside phosphotransferase (APT) family kinase protein
MSGVFRPAGSAVAQDWSALRRWLGARGGVLGATAPRQFGGGLGNLNYLVEVDGRPAVLRRPPAGPLPRGANDVAREHQVLSALWRAYPLAPRALWFCRDPGVLGAPFQIIEHRAGIVIRDSLPAGLINPPDIGAVLSRHLVESLAALHAVDPQAIGLDTLGRPTGFLGRTVEGWATRGAAVIDPANPRAFAETVAWLRRRVPAGAAPCLIHSDFKLDNMIFDPATFAPVAVIDWDMATRGDPLSDLAVLLSYWAEPGDPACIERLRQMPTQEPGFWRRDQAIGAYRRLSGRAVDDFAFYRVLALFRLAIVFLQLFDRWRRDPGGNSQGAHFGALGRGLLDYALEIAHRLH